MLRRIAGAALLVAGTLSPADAQDAPVVSMFVSGDEQSGPFLSYMVEDCGECVIAQFSCGDGGGIAVALLEFDDQTLAKWLADNGAHATLKVGEASLDLSPQQITFSEMSGAWDIKFVAWGSDATAIGPMRGGATPVITTAKGDITLPAREGDAANARLFIDACVKRQ